MSQYTYRLNPGKITAEKHYYKKSQLEQMTTFQLKEICRSERLVTTSVAALDRDGLIRLILRFRGQKEYRHIEGFCKGGMERVQQVLDKIPIHVIKSSGIRMHVNMECYNNMAMDETDGRKVESDEYSLYEGNLLLVDEEFRLQTCLYLKQKGDDYFICKGKEVPILFSQKHLYSILYFPSENNSEYLYEQYWGMKSTFPGNVKCIRIPILSFEVKDVKGTGLPLVIDFGSCNTTMGICLPDGNRKIAFSGNGSAITSMIGITGMYGNEIEYVFGDEALMLSRNNYQDQDVAVFYDIKRWISDPDRKESVILNNGIKVSVSRKEMIKAFFTYLIEQARKQFKYEFRTVQLLAPVRQKEKFEELFHDLIPEIEINCSLDEGIAVLFSSIDKLIARGDYESNHWYRALIIDCGGGTTDLTSGRFRIQSSRVSYNIELETSYENGDTNFGGNNLTYRILQLLKMKIVQALTGNLMEDYEKAEQILPTRFRGYEEKEREAYFYVKNNYYYLFSLAEQVKELFFQSEFKYEMRVGTEKECDSILDKWKLSIVQNGKVKQLDKTIYFPLYLYQIEDSLRKDIYQLMERFLKSKFQNNELQEYNMIKLTGQSCKARLFEEALKEYVPGVLIQRTEKTSNNNELKMCCLEGALSYFFNHKLGYMDVSSTYQGGALPYEIMAYTHEGNKKTLIHSMDRDESIGYISRFKVGRQLDIHLMDSAGIPLKTYYYECWVDEFNHTTQEKIEKQYGGTVIQEETDTILEGEMKFFVWVSRQRWGFFVMPIRRENEQLYQGAEMFFNFEDDTWEENFFDGRK